MVHKASSKTARDTQRPPVVVFKIETGSEVKQCKFYSGETIAIPALGTLRKKGLAAW